MNNFPKIERRPSVLNSLQISRSNLYSKIEKGLFPKPISLGKRCCGWLSTETEQVLGAMIAGQSNEEIKQLVKTLEESRKQFKAVV